MNLSKTKICSKCKIEKALSEFYKPCLRICKKCYIIGTKKYYQKNKRKLKKQAKKYYEKNRREILIKKKSRNRKYIESCPWIRTYRHIMARCYYNKNSSYYKKGIKNYLKMQELKFLWFRDKAYLMDKPSINRKDNNKHYVLDNCQYIELLENCRKKR